MGRILIVVVAAAVVIANAFSAEYVCTLQSQPTRSGIPLGGLGCGTVEIRGDGAFHEWQIFNNMCQPVSVPEALLAARIRLGGRQSAFALQLKPPADIPGVPQIVYRGEVPYAWLTYTAPDNIPVR
ncbi:MAG: hypothetical protein H5T86_08495, partial [Armatimonadetes bacterium]|nr:hypothetical protein [Armatimonadota bacterium]